MNFLVHRPPGFEGQGDKHLPRLVTALTRRMLKAQQGFAYDSLKLPPETVERLAAAVAQFLNKRLPDLPQDSGAGHFLARPNKFGWEVKRKLIWLGQHSYLFRLNFENYVAAKNVPLSISLVDDFICQEATTWSGPASSPIGLFTTAL